MKKFKLKIGNSFYLLSLYILFPGFYLYHFLLSRGVITSMLGGYFGVVSLSLLLPLAFFHYRKPIKFKSLPVCIFYLILFYNSAVAVVNYLQNIPYGHALELMRWSVTGSLFMFVIYLICANLKGWKAQNWSVGWIIMMVGIASFNIGNEDIFNAQSSALVDEEGVASYQGFSRSLLMLVLFTISSLKTRGNTFYFVSAAGFIGFIFIGARSEFIIYGIVLVITGFSYSLSILRILVLSIFFGILAYFFIIIAYQYFPESRMLEIRYLFESSSWLARADLNNYALERIQQRPILGDYGSYVQLGGVGAYPHNLLSSWVNLGIIGFGLYLIMFLYLWVDLFKGLRSGSMSRELRVFFVFLLYCTFALVTSKCHIYMLIGAVLGFHRSYRLALRNI